MFVFALGVQALLQAAGPTPRIAYLLSIDSTSPNVVHVSMAIENAPPTFHLAMKVHAEYDARYWRFLDSLRIDGGTVTREDSTLWAVQRSGGSGTIHYRVTIQPPTMFGGLRRVWMPFARADGATINPPDVFLYVPELADAPIRLALQLPASWQVATALAEAGVPTRRTALTARTLLDSPILAGHLRSWSFQAGGTTFHVAYWPDPTPGAFNDSMWVDAMHRLATQSLAIFGTMPTRDYWFLLEDGAGDALEHAASVTLGVQHLQLQRDPHAGMTELAHEFFHTWNLVAIRPAGYNDLSFRPAARTPSLWLGEGVTLYYANLLRWRGMVVGGDLSRRDSLLARALSGYYARPWLEAVPPTRASLAFPDSRPANPDATGGFYLQGELLGFELDAVIRDSTHDARSLDDVMSAMYTASQRPGYAGYSTDDVVHAADSVCECRLDPLFDRQVRGADVIDISPVLRRLEYKMIVDTLPAAPAANGQTSPPLNIRVRFVDADSVSPGAAAKRLAWLEGRR